MTNYDDRCAWQDENQSLRGEIDQLQRLVRDLTKNVDTIQEQCQTPPKIPIKNDPQIVRTLL